MSTSVYTLDLGDRLEEIQRLEFQHREVFLPVTGRLVPEEILQFLSSLGRAPVVADVATGTGLWLRDLAMKLSPDAQLDGYDLDTAKFLEPSQLPPNVKLMQGNALEPFPPEKHESYDFVHIRFMLYGLKAHQWDEIAINVQPLLRPGGYLLWEEAGYPGMTCLPMTESFQKLMNINVRHAALMERDIT
ncbi:methyltransferase [Hirsutella rhossiliensis]|uniref:Methyltransferase domain-containing protein n=1 Tax=Hirsutella rhossiliensis TaxID=111463 RepID=A0A9P8SD01_9HYPO|nr:methyltransferase domain-containing protein [Hirsutella rhossiliensis]KAH0958203.1 methyltransferase domain-containing protein [Hirsutella rhossiliensis]